jgi:hypothetical protein
MNDAQQDCNSPAPASLIPTLDPPAGWLDASPATMAEALRDEFPTAGPEKERNWIYKYPEGKTADAINDLGLQEHYPHLS